MVVHAKKPQKPRTRSKNNAPVDKRIVIQPDIEEDEEGQMMLAQVKVPSAPRPTNKKPEGVHPSPFQLLALTL